ncbi:MAG: polysaccharide deacetylase family protein [Chthoniobacterales bacterium]|nr:polysaccharide deacetylase family protein [Chthoniobacterales bacterium]
MSSSHYSIFADPRGRRRRILQGIILVLALLLLGASAYFVSSLLVAPQLHLPQEVRLCRTQLKSKSLPVLLTSKEDWHHFFSPEEPYPFPTNILGNGALYSLLLLNPLSLEKNHTAAAPLATSPFPIHLGFVNEGDAQGIRSLKEHVDQLTHVATDYFSLIGVEGNLREESAEEVRTFSARKGLGWLPILKNNDGDLWQPEAIEGLLKIPPEEQSSFLDHLISRMPSGSLGLLIDWNDVDPSYRNEITQLLTQLGNKLHQHRFELWLTVPTERSHLIYDLGLLSSVVDHFVATLYDENSEHDDPGPLAENDWVEQELSAVLCSGKPEQWVGGLGVYGLDWNTTKETVEQLSFANVMARAYFSDTHDIKVETPQDSPSFHYLSGSESNEEHEVWFEDAITFFNQLRLLAPYHLGGIAIDALGLEDPSIWAALHLASKLSIESRSEPTPEELEQLETLDLKSDVASIGTGDFLSLGNKAEEGWRRVTLAADNLLDATYEEIPMPSCVYHQGAGQPHQVTLTFDDGPDPKWTPLILKILQQKKVPATFFVVGSQVQQFPDLLQRIQKTGNEIGNHTYTHPNLGEISEEQIYLELNATTRLIESITGHSTSLFRPPYNGDGNPSTPGELRALQTASDLGYLTVGESIDSCDWERPGVETIINRVEEGRARGGKVILFHDAGGNRSQTVAALPQIIDYLQERGDQIVPLSTLIGLPQETLMPSLHKSDLTMAVRYVYGSFATLRFLELAAWTLFIVITILSLFFIFFFVGCTLCHRQMEKRDEELTDNRQLTMQPCPHEGGDDNCHRAVLPPASVIIAAYNEERVIASTIEHLLESYYEGFLELLIVDDGSQDQTTRVVEKCCKKMLPKNRSILLLKQPNLGKATALNRAVAAASHELIVTLDADTMVTPEALTELLAPFNKEAVGAVSGHIRVGNCRHWLGRFQQIEYEFAFEINRRAQDFLHCITVVPGALSAFRRSALQEAGPLNTETLAEDTDLTLQLHRLNWEITYAPRALADTEAPSTIRALFSQRFRWAFGTLQCLWKHRSLTFNPDFGWLGWLALPSVWIFQLGVIALTPILDLVVILSLFFGQGKTIWPYFVASLFFDTWLAALAAYYAERSPWSAWRALPMRFLYRPILGYVVWKCFFKAAAGSFVRWVKLERTAAAIEQKEGDRHAWIGENYKINISPKN